MLSEIARIAIRHLNKNGFEAFVKYLIENDSNFYTARSLTNIDERIIECPPERYYQSADAFFLNYHPTSLYKDFSLRNIDFDCLEKMISNYLKNRTYSLWLPTDGTTIYSINNYDSSNLGISDEELLYYYEKNLCGLLSKDVRLGIGNVNTFLQKAESEGGDVSGAVSSFFNGLRNGLSVSISDNGISADFFVGGKELPGITAYSHSIANPVIKLVSMSNVLDKFNSLLNSESKEHELEEFLSEHYRFCLERNMIVL